MKTIILSLMMLLPVIYLPAQNRSIDFEAESSFNAALKKAREQGKLLFMDCYTSWCGPCKMIAKTVFTVDSIADFFNTHFVNLKVDMEKGEGVQLKAKYRIEAYPTLLLIDENGEDIFRMVGGCSADNLLAQMREGMKPENSISALNRKFDAGCRDQLFIRSYCEVLRQGYQQERLQQVLQEYFREMEVKEICEEVNWEIYDSYVQDINDPLFHRMIEHIAEFKAMRGNVVMEQKLGEAYAFYIFRSIPNVSLTEKQYRQFTKDIEKIGISDSLELFYLKSYLEIARMKMLKQYDALLDLVEAGPVGYNLDRRMTLMMSFSFLADGTRDQRIRGLKLLGREVRAWQKREGETLAPNIANILGQVQHALMGKDISYH